MSTAAPPAWLLPVVIVAVLVLAAVVAGVVVVMWRRGRVPSRPPVATHDGWIVSARVQRLPALANSLNAGDPRTIGITVRFERDGHEVHAQMPSRTPKALPLAVRRRIVGPVLRDDDVNIRVSDPAERRIANQRARGAGYTMPLDPEIAVTLYELDEGTFEWRLDRGR